MNYIDEYTDLLPQLEKIKIKVALMTNETEMGSRFNSDKPKITLVLEASEAIIGVTRVLEHGMEKYDRGNWHKGLIHTEIVDSMMRHLIKYMRGEDLDKDSGLPHVDHIACNAIFLSELSRTKPELDDRICAKERQSL